MSGVIPPLPLYSFMGCTGVHGKEKCHQNTFIALQASGQGSNSNVIQNRIGFKYTEKINLSN